jgi:hypothetical protein
MMSDKDSHQRSDRIKRVKVALKNKKKAEQLTSGKRKLYQNFLKHNELDKTGVGENVRTKLIWK